MIDAKSLIEMLESSYDGIWITDGNGRILFANSANASLLGVTKEDLMGKSTEELLEKKIFSDSVCLEAIEQKRHEGDKVRKKKVLPYYLKEDQQRWYLLAYDNNILKTFNIDCIRNLQILYEETFKRDMNIDANNLFKDSYGIWNQTDIPVENIELSYSALDGSFLKSIPLHHSQEIITDNEMEFRIRLRLRITNDFVMALLSRSSSLTVIEPSHLRERIRRIYEEAIKRHL